MDFSHRTFLVLELPQSKWVDQVQNFRQKYEEWRRNLPVEVTIIGSSGVGVFAKEQDPQKAIEAVDRLASRTDPFILSFCRKNSFPETNLYFFEPANTSAFTQLQDQIVSTQLKFAASPFPFIPHCTIADLGEAPTKESLVDLDSIPVPQEKIIINAISFYQLRDRSCHLLHRSKFRDH